MMNPWFRYRWFRRSSLGCLLRGLIVGREAPAFQEGLDFRVFAGKCDHNLNARQIHAAMPHQIGDAFQPFHVFLGVKAGFPHRATRADQPFPLVLADGLLVEAQQMGHYADGIDRMVWMNLHFIFSKN
jgi:hypothetical protein